MPSVPFGAVIATATPKKYHKIQKGLGFDEKLAVRIIEKVNRPNLFFGVCKIKGSRLGNVDLNFLILEELLLYEDPQSIPKTIIYINQKKIASQLVVILRTRVL